MNLHGLVSGSIAAVNPMTAVTYQISTGYVAMASGKREPVYSTPITESMQVQQLSTSDLKLIENKNITGVTRKVYLTGQLNTINRAGQLGGDKLVFDSQNWLVVHVLEQFPEWSCVVVKQQVNP